MDLTEQAEQASMIAPKSIPSTTPTSKSPSSTHSHSPILVVSSSLRSSPDRFDGEEGELEIDLPVLGCQTPASAGPRLAPSPIAWSAGGWNPGMFSFDLSSTKLSSHEEEDDETEVGEPGVNLGDQVASRLSRLSLHPDPTAKLGSDHHQTPITIDAVSADNQHSTHTSLGTKLAQTAPSFAFKPNPDAAAFVPPQPSQTISIDEQSPVPFPGNSSIGGSSELDREGQAVGSAGTYSLTDGVLSAQSLATRPFGPSRAQTFSGSARPISEQPQSQVGHRQQASWQGSFGRSTGTGLSSLFPPTPPLSIHGSDYHRARSASVGSSYIGSYFAPHASDDFVGYQSTQQAQELQKQAADQLQSYFGPSTVGVNAPPGTYPPPPTNFYEPVQPVYATSAAPPRPVLDVSSMSPLYLAARETFVTLAVARLDPVSAATALPSLAAHFDLAMSAPHPLAALYGVTSERADELAAAPALSGIDELVLRVAAHRVGYRPGPGEVGGPSPSNTKKNLYKSELCRSWEEKGSCRYGVKCQFAHSAAELRPVQRHSKYKSESCRTFLTTGVCPYGARCVFRHTADLEGAQAGPPQHSRSNSVSAPSRGLTEDPALTRSRLALRTSTSAVPVAGFGPALANYLGPSASTGSTPTHSHPASPAQERFTPFESSFPSSITGNGADGRRFSTSGEVPSGQVPPQFAEAPQSRLRRLSTQQGMSRSGSVSSGSTVGGSLRARASFESASALQQFALTAQHRNGNNLSSHPITRQPSFTNPFAPIPGTPSHGASMQAASSQGPPPAATSPRHGSTSSFGSFASSSGYASSFLPRRSSSSSLSSFGSREHSGALKPAGVEWFGAAGHVGGNVQGQGGALHASLEWPEESGAGEREATPRSNATVFGGPDALLG